MKLNTGRALLALTAALAFPARAATPASAPARPPNLTVAGDKSNQVVDCKGADVTIASSDSTLTLSRCNGVIVAGSRDRVIATLLEDSDILVLGDHDVVRWTAFPGASPVVTDRGKHNTTAPF